VVAVVTSAVKAATTVTATMVATDAKAVTVAETGMAQQVVASATSQENAGKIALNAAEDFKFSFS